MVLIELDKTSQANQWEQTSWTKLITRLNQAEQDLLLVSLHNIVCIAWPG